MSERANYTPYHPRWYRRRMSTYWWLSRWEHFRFILREISSVFVAWFVVYLLLLIDALRHGPAAYQQFLHWAANPWVVSLNVISLGFVVFHSCTWFNLAPNAMIVHMRGKRVPGSWIIAGNYGAWVVVSIVLAWIILRG